MPGGSFMAFLPELATNERTEGRKADLFAAKEFNDAANLRTGTTDGFNAETDGPPFEASPGNSRSETGIADVFQTARRVSYRDCKSWSYRP
jgi:hypothetical protein